MLEGATIVVTGVGTGLGSAVARLALRDGANVVLGARTAATLGSIATELDPTAARVAHLATDIADAGQCDALAQLAVDRFGAINGVVQVAAKEAMGGLAATKGALHALMYHLATDLGPRRIRVNMIVPSWMWGPAVQQFVAGQAQLRGVDEAQVVAEIAAPMPLGEIPTVEDVAEAALFLCSDRARTITGQTLFVNAGNHMT